jgi:hypothetical protein
VRLGAAQRWHQKRHQDADHRDHDQEIDQCESIDRF